MATTTDSKRAWGRRARGSMLVGLLVLAAPSVASAQDLEAARKAFTAAFAEESAGHYSEALEKFLEVQRVRDTASVRYRIASCLEALGKLERAREAYLAIEQVARAEDAEVVTSSKAKAKELEGRLGELSLRIDGDGPEGRAAVDGTDLPLTGGGATVFLMPGEHRVTFEPRGEPPMVTPITLEGGRRTVLVLNRRGTPATAPLPPKRPTEPVVPPPKSTGPSTVGVVGVVVGAALVAGAVVSFVLRESAISSIEADCPNGACPRSKEGDVTSARSRAQALLPVGAVMGVAGGLALGGGVYFLVRPSPKTTAQSSAGTLTFALEVPWP
jgi:hypothetical protein